MRGHLMLTADVGGAHQRNYRAAIGTLGIQIKTESREEHEQLLVKADERFRVQRQHAFHERTLADGPDVAEVDEAIRHRELTDRDRREEKVRLVSTVFNALLQFFCLRHRIRLKEVQRLYWRYRCKRLVRAVPFLVLGLLNLAIVPQHHCESLPANRVDDLRLMGPGCR